MQLMEKDEYYRMYEVEEEHWWYKSLRNVFFYFIGKSNRKGGKILDAGCGTGQNMSVLQSKGYKVSGFDISEDAISLSKKRGVKDIKIASVTKIPYKNNVFDTVLNLDVLGNLSQKEVKKAILEFHRVLRPSGLLIIQAAALEWLRSKHDIVVGTRHRFSKKELESLFDENKWKTVKSSYRFFFFFPLLAAIKYLKKLKKTQKAESDLYLAPKLINSILFGIQYLEDFLLRYVSLPIGTSLFIIVKKE